APLPRRLAGERGAGGSSRLAVGRPVRFQERLYGRGRDRLGVLSSEADEGADVGGGVVAARLPRDRLRHIRLQFGCTRRPEGARARGRSRRGASAVPTGLWSRRRRGRWIRGGTRSEERRVGKEGRSGRAAER